MTVGELKAVLGDYDDNMPICIEIESGVPYTCGYFKNLHVRLDEFTKVNAKTVLGYNVPKMLVVTNIATKCEIKGF